MLSAASHLSFGGSTLATTVFLERRVRLHLVTRDRLVFDTAYSPPIRAVSPFVHLYFQITGALAISGRAAAPGPCAFVLAEAEFDRVTPSSLTFRSSGERCTILEVRVAAADLHLPVGLSHGPVDLAPPVWDALYALAAEPHEPGVQRLIDALGTTSVFSHDLTRSIVAEEPERFVRLWAAMRPLYQSLSTSASLKQIASFTGLSLRQLGRDLTDLTRTFGLFGGGFRDAMRILRLRAAVLLLSAPQGTPSEVARVVGYGSVDAMGRAFRDAALPPPSIIAEAVRYRGAPSA